jgi:ribosomal protein S18 acetylase RimI-like enzyme
MASFRIERVGPGDSARLARIAPEVFSEPLDPQWLEAYLAERLMLLVIAVEGDLVVGQVKCAVHRHPEKPSDGYIDDVRVTPASQRRGIARAMLAEMERWAREKGCADLWLATEPGNAGARALYGSFAEPKPCVLYYWDL